MKPTDSDFMAMVRKRMGYARDAALPHMDRGQNDQQHIIGHQWREEDRLQRESEGKPCLVFNALPQYVRQVTGQIRSLNPAIKVLAADSAATKDVAEILEGLIRHIEYKSDAPSVYEAAAESAAQCSVGYWRVRTEYCDDTSFDQDIVIERIHNPWSVFIDPMAKHTTRRDAQFAFIVDEMPLDEFRLQYPDASTADFTADHRVTDLHQWVSADTIVLAEYYWIEHEEYEIGQAPDGTVLRAPFPQGLPISRRRKVRAPRVKWAKVTGTEVLEGPVDVPGKYIPIVAVTGEEIHLGEEVYISSVIRFAKDAQMLYNVTKSSEAETVMLQPRAPFMVTTKQIAGLEEFWADANSANRPYLPYNPDPEAPMPQRIAPPVSSQGLMVQAQMAIEDMKRTTGIYDASLGARSNETSGVAIQQRQMEAQNGTSIYQDNMIKGVRQTGELILAMIPQVYDTQRAVRILGEDDQEKIVLINQMLMTQDGPMPVNDVTVGRYDVRMAVGPTYATRRQESADKMMEFLRGLPAAAPMIADLIAKSQDWPEADRIAERLRKTLPPEIADDEDDEPSPEQAQAKAMAMQQAQMQAQMQAQAQEIEMRKAAAEAQEAEADAVKAQAEAQKAQLELAAATGQLEALINQRVTQAVGAIMAPQPPQVLQPTF